MSVDSEFINGNLCFKNFVIVRKKETFYGVYERSILSHAPCGELITSGETLDKAARKAKLLQIGYDMCRDNMRDAYFI